MLLNFSWSGVILLRIPTPTSHCWQNVGNEYQGVLSKPLKNPFTISVPRNVGVFCSVPAPPNPRGYLQRSDRSLGHEGRKTDPNPAVTTISLRTHGNLLFVLHNPRIWQDYAAVCNSRVCDLHWFYVTKPLVANVSSFRRHVCICRLLHHLWWGDWDVTSQS